MARFQDDGGRRTWAEEPITEPVPLPPMTGAPPRTRRRRWPLMLGALVLALSTAGATTLVVGLFPQAVVQQQATASAPAIGPLSAPSPESTSAHPPSRTSPSSAPSLALIDASGTALPTTSIAGIERTFEALRRGDATTVRALYTATPDNDAWSIIAPRVALPKVRARLVAAMQKRPTRGEDVDILYLRDRYSVGFSARGELVYIEAGQHEGPTGRPATTPSADGGFPTSPSDPYGCLAADRAMEAEKISYAEHPCASHFQNSADPTEMQPDTPATRWALCHAPARSEDPDYIVGGRKRYCR